MAEVHDQRQGIKLFGATIGVEVRELAPKDHVDHQPIIKKSDDEQTTLEKRPEKIIPCPRCKSMETKFCYFNNYNVNQPRHFCKGCQRYWTAGGALRDVPVGAGRRKNKPPPPCRQGFSAEMIIGSNCFFDAQQFDFDGVVEEWRWAAVQGGFGGVFPAKRRRSSSGGQSC